MHQNVCTLKYKKKFSQKLIILIMNGFNFEQLESVDHDPSDDLGLIEGEFLRSEHNPDLFDLCSIPHSRAGLPSFCVIENEINDEFQIFHSKEGWKFRAAEESKEEENSRMISDLFDVEDVMNLNSFEPNEDKSKDSELLPSTAITPDMFAPIAKQTKVERYSLSEGQLEEEKAKGDSQDAFGAVHTSKQRRFWSTDDRGKYNY